MHMTSQAQTAANKRYYEKNKARWKTYSKRYRSKPGGQLKSILHGVRHRARIHGIAFDEAISALQIPDRCPVLDIPIKLGEGLNSPFSPSFDRLDPKKGYTLDNVRVISLRANVLKRDGTLEEFILIIEYLKKYTK